MGAFATSLAGYSTCIFCNGALGRNEAIEHFPVGRRLAFDSAKGRLWVICARCERWNLTPIETRWEAIEDAERAFRAAKLRSSTEHVGLAKVAEGTTLVRIGSPLLPEFAGWRYGGVFRKRYLKQFSIAQTAPIVLMAPAALMLSGIAMPTLLVAGATAGAMALNMSELARSFYRVSAPRLNIHVNDGTIVRLTALDVGRSVMTSSIDHAWTLRIAHRVFAAPTSLHRALRLPRRMRFTQGYSDVSGDNATRALATMLPSINHLGDRRRTVAEAVDVVSSHADLRTHYLDRTDPQGRSFSKLGATSLGRLPSGYRLALEMLLHESDERRALAGAMAELETRWREAEEIASIADNLL